MHSFLNTLLGWLGLAPPRLRCRAVIWNEGVQELARRTDAAKAVPTSWVGIGVMWPGHSHFIYYDDVDPEALSTGIVL